MAPPGYGQIDSRVYAPDMGQVEIEMPLTQRLEGLYARLKQSLLTLEELQHGPQPEDGIKQVAPMAGVLNLASECDKVSMALENQVMIVAKRIGRL